MYKGINAAEFRFRMDSKFSNKVYVIVVLDLSKVANPVYLLRDKDLFKSRDPQVVSQKNELEAKGTLLRALQEKHQLKFNIHKDAKSHMEAIEKSLPSKWKTHTLIWRNKAGLEEQSLDDLFNNLKIYEAEVKGSATSSQNTQNIAFVSSNNTDSTTESVIVVPSVFAASSKATVSTLLNFDSLSDVVIYSFFTRNADHQRTTGINTLLEELFQWKYLLQMLWCLCVMQLVAMTGVFKPTKNLLIMHLWHKPPQLHSHESDNNVPKSPKNDMYKTCEGYHDVPLPYTRTFMPPKPNLVFHDDPNASESVANVFHIKSSKNKPCKYMSKTLRPDASIVQDWISDSEDETEIEYVPKQKEPSFVPNSKHVKTPRESVKKVEHPKQAKKLRTNNQQSRGHKKN
nr:hypothetical protein [Tanacetum cinerariifolium]